MNAQAATYTRKYSNYKFFRCCCTGPVYTRLVFLSIICRFSAIRMQDQQVFHQFKPGAVLYCFHGRNTSQSAGM